jgi:hypothetical protein
MANFEDLRMVDLVQKFKGKVQEIYESKKLGGFRALSADLQNVYNFYLTANNSFLKQEEAFKSLFSSFNYAAVIINNAIKQGGLQGDDGELLAECMQVMLRSCDLICSSLQQQ